jgi:uncharacterized protein (TIGR02231 family)
MLRFSSSLKSLLLVSVFTLSPVLSAESLAAEFTTDSDVSAVTVYQNRAKVERSSMVKIPKGAHTVLIENLPTDLDVNSIRVAGEAIADVLIGTVKSEIKYTPHLTSEREKILQTQITKLQNDVKKLNAEKSALSTSQQFLQKLGEQARLRSGEDMAEMSLNSAEWLTAAQTIHKGMSDILSKKLDIDIKVKGVNDEIRALQQELNKSRGGQKSTYSVSVAVEADAATDLALDLSYFTYNATWQPLYDARLNKVDDGATSLELVQYGAVSQNTGEDWEDVALTLSTAQPNRNARLGALQSRWIDMYDLAMGKRMNERNEFANRAAMAVEHSRIPMPQASGMADAEMAIEDPLSQWRKSEAMGAPKIAKARVRSAAIQSNGFTVEYSLPGKLDVKSDGSETKLRVGSADVTHKLKTVIRPQLSQAAYFIADMTASEDAPLLGGRVALYRDDAFIGNAQMPFVAAGKSHELSYGLNDNVQVAFKTLKDKSEEAGYISDNTRQKQMVAELENVSNETFDIALEMARPVSKNDDLSVTVQKDFTTKGYQDDWENVKGIMHWDGKLVPKTKAEYKLGYEITWPKGYQITGRY